MSGPCRFVHAWHNRHPFSYLQCRVYPDLSVLRLTLRMVRSRWAVGHYQPPETVHRRGLPRRTGWSYDASCGQSSNRGSEKQVSPTLNVWELSESAVSPMSRPSHPSEGGPDPKSDGLRRRKELATFIGAIPRPDGQGSATGLQFCRPKGVDFEVLLCQARASPNAAQRERRPSPSPQRGESEKGVPTENRFKVTLHSLVGHLMSTSFEILLFGYPFRER